MGSPKYAPSKDAEETQQKGSPDAVPAHMLWLELVSLNTIVSRHNRSGNEETVAHSIFRLFQKAQKLIEEHPDAAAFSDTGLHMVNEILRPYAAQWHQLMTEIREEDGRSMPRFPDELARRKFRSDLRELRSSFIAYEEAFRALSGGSRGYQRPAQIRSNRANLGRPLIAGIGLQVPVRGGFPDAAGTQEINEKEHQFVLERRRLCYGRPGYHTVMDASGLALSGGGIRSATFCLGVVQVLARMRLLGEIDYLSTVSGGGYLGTFLSSFFNGLPTQTPNKTLADQLAPVDDVEPAAIQHIRNNSKYLLDGGVWGKLNMAALLLSGLATNILTVLPLPLIVAFVLCFLNWLGFWGDKMPGAAFRLSLADRTPSAVALIALGGLLALSWLQLTIVRRWALQTPADLKLAKISGVFSAGTFVLLVVVALFGILFLVPSFFDLYNFLANPSKPGWHLSDNAITAILGLLPFLSGAAASMLKTGRLQKFFSWLLVLSGPLFCLWVILFAGAKLGMTGDPQWNWMLITVPTALLLLWSIFCVDINSGGPHGYYRDRLCKCYLIYKDALQNVRVRQPLRLAEMQTPGLAPYHLINTVVNLPRSANPELRGRKSDFFILSPFFCGSPICGYVNTSLVEQTDPHLDLGTAMAISGVEASMGMRWRTLRIFRFLMAILNVRLGYWFPNVRRLNRRRGRGVGLKYFLAEITDLIQENMKYLNISDGAHIEHLGVYELLRRRCKFIICVHGDAELKSEDSDLQRVERYAINDLGIKLEYNPADLQPDKGGMSRAYAILIKILYRSEEDGSNDIGWMIYLKPALTGVEPRYVLDYRRRNPRFPYEGTVEQDFGEEQFEAYRALGERAASDLFREELMGCTPPHDLRDWFQRLADNLLPDDDEAFLRSYN